MSWQNHTQNITISNIQIKQYISNRKTNNYKNESNNKIKKYCKLKNEEEINVCRLDFEQFVCIRDNNRYLIEIFI